MIWVLWLFVLVAIALVALAFYYRSQRKNVVTFFHPNCLDCGGGEKVLWVAVDALKEHLPEMHLFAQDATNDSAQEKVNKVFKINIPSNIKFVNVGSADFIKPGYYKHFTLIFQAIGSLVYAFKCLNKEVPAIVIDTTGAPFASIVWKLFGGCKVILYIHYPFISTDMLKAVSSGNDQYNNNQKIAKSKVLTSIKIIYYRIIAFIYSLCGYFADVITVNSTWTGNHIREIFRRDPIILFPPCDTTDLSKLPIENRIPEQIISVQQFRPEKNLPLQLEIIRRLKDTHPNMKLYIIGGCRNEADKKLLDGLQEEIDRDKLPITLVPNCDFDILRNEYFARSSVGLHTMYNEHFGICAVEYLAAGLIPLCNKSAGPLYDIVKDENYLALTADEYAAKLEVAFKCDDSARLQFRNSCSRFSYEEFSKQFIAAVAPLIKSEVTNYKE
ncbi:glycosyl transferase, group 1 family protein [Trichomonas vaginalis G3]|uniref:GDP-Man:Man(3)GlcNAc(2)-PP-Dol alpha-1,2-mannosyltransferase n=1 Tax=Trichomonas vaginalis (strain ATCC PRA-98 / G3) TaxID=412133 RepID=A2FR43_TRIV3|nr:glycosyl transferase [Trichomonas vaginalis G3]EAX92632.1 glycosyl transferase, group 1 family protein [Trichomonas vaginalis G3]KAI5540092.1 GDP-Man:Man3GlcNAc2-PP-Dol alpha-1,2-mannosyltransferase protein [Trichomonas vaginalis G3]|eukprot:XP_001305562.1 glycosyl transferase [Trichomonas vaginalis G3]